MVVYHCEQVMGLVLPGHASPPVQAVLYGIFPLSLSGGFASYCYMKYRSRRITKFVAGNAQSKDTLVLKNVHRFKNVAEVQLVACHYYFIIMCVRQTCNMLLLHGSL